MTLHLGRRKAREALSRLKLVRVGKPFNVLLFEAFAAKIRESFLDIISETELVQYDPPPVESLDASLLTKSLNLDVGGHILGVTEVDLLDRSSDDFWNFMFGGKDNSNDVAVVSTKRLQGRSSDVATARLLKVALHEIGHNFGLMHHYGQARAADGGYCPMTKGDFNRFGERGYVRAIIDTRGFRFCRNCERFLQANYA